MNPPTFQNTCTICGKTFATFKPHGRYCSAGYKRAALLSKRHEAGRWRRHRRCPRCGNVFVAARADGVYCSNACRQAVHRVRHRAERLS
jgi:ribosomal protein S27AE